MQGIVWVIFLYGWMDVCIIYVCIYGHTALLMGIYNNY